MFRRTRLWPGIPQRSCDTSFKKKRPHQQLKRNEKSSVNCYRDASTSLIQFSRKLNHYGAESDHVKRRKNSFFGLSQPARGTASRARPSFSEGVANGGFCGWADGGGIRARICGFLRCKILRGAR